MIKELEELLEVWERERLNKWSSCVMNARNELKRGGSGNKKIDKELEDNELFYTGYCTGYASCIWDLRELLLKEEDKKNDI